MTALVIIIHFRFHKSTYIHSWTLQPFSYDYGLVSQTTQVVCLNFVRELQDLKINVDSERQIFEKLFMAVQQKSAESKKYFLYLVLMSSLGFEP